MTPNKQPSRACTLLEGPTVQLICLTQGGVTTLKAYLQPLSTNCKGFLAAMQMAAIARPSRSICHTGSRVMDTQTQHSEPPPQDLQQAP